MSKYSVDHPIAVSILKAIKHVEYSGERFSFPMLHTETPSKYGWELILYHVEELIFKKELKMTIEDGIRYLSTK